jgi:cytochrome c556
LGPRAVRVGGKTEAKPAGRFPRWRGNLVAKRAGGQYKSSRFRRRGRTSSWIYCHSPGRGREFRSGTAAKQGESLMNRWMGLALVLALVVSFTVAAEDKNKEEKIPTIKEIMKTAHGKTGLLSKVTAEVNNKDWDALATNSKKLTELATALTKTTPKKGEKESWEMLTTSYLKTAKELTEASEKKDVDVAVTAVGTLAKSCRACHTAHKGK